MATTKYLFPNVFPISSLNSSLNTRKSGYFDNAKDLTLIASQVVLESFIQKKDSLSIWVSTLRIEAILIFNTSDLTVTSTAKNISSQMAVYPVGQADTIPNDILAPGPTQKRLEDNLTKMLIDKKLLFDSTVTAYFLNCAAAVQGKVNGRCTITTPGGQLVFCKQWATQGPYYL